MLAVILFRIVIPFRFLAGNRTIHMYRTTQLCEVWSLTARVTVEVTDCLR